MSIYWVRGAQQRRPGAYITGKKSKKLRQHILNMIPYFRVLFKYNKSAQLQYEISITRCQMKSCTFAY